MNIFEIGKTISEIALKNDFCPLVNKEIAARGWFNETEITEVMSNHLFKIQKQTLITNSPK